MNLRHAHLASIVWVKDISAAPVGAAVQSFIPTSQLWFPYQHHARNLVQFGVIRRGFAARKSPRSFAHDVLGIRQTCDLCQFQQQG